MASVFARAVFAQQVRRQTGKAGLAGLVLGIAINSFIRRAPRTAILTGIALLGYQAYKTGKENKARDEAVDAMTGKPAATGTPSAAPPTGTAEARTAPATEAGFSPTAH